MLTFEKGKIKGRSFAGERIWLHCPECLKDITDAIKVEVLRGGSCALVVLLIILRRFRILKGGAMANDYIHYELTQADKRRIYKSSDDFGCCALVYRPESINIEAS